MTAGPLLTMHVPSIVTAEVHVPASTPDELLVPVHVALPAAAGAAPPVSAASATPIAAISHSKAARRRNPCTSMS